jgi:hypothetical protein
VQSMFLHYSYASEIVKLMNKISISNKKKTFDLVLGKLNAVEPRSCAKCGLSVVVQRVLLKPWPKVLALCIAWSDPDPPLNEVMQLLSSFDQEIDLGKVFKDETHKKRYRMRGLICYYLKHYAAYFFNDKENVWFSFDDVSVQEGMNQFVLFCICLTFYI